MTEPGLDPVRIAQVETEGAALRVVCAGSLAAIADGFAGLAIIDLIDPPAAQVRHQVKLGTVNCVSAAGGVAVVGTAEGEVGIVDLETGIVLQTLALGDPVHDVLSSGDFVHAISMHTEAYGLGAPMAPVGLAKAHQEASGFVRCG